MASKRFPRKFIQTINGKPMFWHVYNNVVNSPWLDGVCAGFPLKDIGIRLDADRFGVPYVVTYEDHTTGTDRAYEVVKRLGMGRGVVVNIQADEPLITHKHVAQVVSMMQNPTVQVSTLVYESDAGDANDVKVQFDSTGSIYNFTRLDSATPRYYTQIGIMAFRVGVLADFAKLGPSEREKQEKIELLRCLDNDIPVHVEVAAPTISVDVPDDLERVKRNLWSTQKWSGSDTVGMMTEGGGD
jgi:3-deoxy-manno-octulosonate cytidylyltransferase (CMP-KDO synthetase)